MSAKHERLYFLLQRAAHLLKKRADARLVEAGGLTTSQAAVMAIVASQGDVSQRYLADTLKQRESAVGAMTERLLNAGYITRNPSQTDGRAWVLRPTTAGREALEAIAGPFAGVNALLDEAFPDADMGRMAESLRFLIDALEAGKV